ncbi:MAG TPA: hypothetical protein VLD59_00050 [Steroidobacteraceae bacterium]|nr:hypothetical protein [Steroidobacteraceae bacterium]
MYEIIWFQLLELVIGSTGVSLGILLGTFMGGMCLGSLLLPRWISPAWHPLRVYAVLEAGIAVLGVLVLFAVPVAGRLYAANVATGLPGLLLRGFTCAVLLLPPAIMMGATLPAVARWVKATPKGVSWLGFFYGSNIVGAVFGCLFAGFPAPRARYGCGYVRRRRNKHCCGDRRFGAGRARAEFLLAVLPSRADA